MGLSSGPRLSHACAILIQLLLMLCIPWTIADVVIIRPDNLTENVFIDTELVFTAAVPKGGIKGIVEVANPPDACSPIDSPPYVINSTLEWFVLIARNSCSLEMKVKIAQAAGYFAVIIYNVGLSRHTQHNTSKSSLSDADIIIPGVLIGQDDGMRIHSLYTYKTGYTVLINPDSTVNVNAYLLPFAIVIGFCFIIMLLFMIVKCIKDRRRSRRNRLSSRQLKHLQTTKFKKGDKYEICAVCLEDYCEGEKLRILPCSHAYHTKCIDPWLTNNHRNCPMCKRKVSIPGVTPDSDSEDSEADQDDSETRPLLSASRRSSIYQTLSETDIAEQSGQTDSSGNQTSRDADQNDDVSVQGSVGYEYRLLYESIPGPSSRSDSYQGESSAQFNSSSTSTQLKKQWHSFNISSDEDEEEQDTFHSRRQLALLNSLSINGEDEDEEIPPSMIVANESRNSTKKGQSKLVV